MGGDLNTIRGGDREIAYGLARTHLMGRLDYLFSRLADGWRADARWLDERFGSDHYAVLGRFSH